MIRIDLAACVCGFFLDFLFGDPVWLYHPVRLIGKLISFLEHILYGPAAQKRRTENCSLAAEATENKNCGSAAQTKRTENHGPDAEMTGNENCGSAAETPGTEKSISYKDTASTKPGLIKDGETKNFGLRIRGGILWAVTAGLSFLLPFLLLRLVFYLQPVLAFVLETFWCYQIFAARSLVTESRKVYNQLKKGNLAAARQAVSMIVGRDTENLTAEGVTKAAVETVAENTSDGVTAPMLFLLLGGAPLGFLYKAVNTMDSMLGYKNERYRDFGFVPAKMDDLFNYIPSRLSAWAMIAAAFLPSVESGKTDGRNALRIYRRDRRKHKSPNAAQTESVCAGALHLRLAGDAVYFGEVYKKDWIGDDDRPIEPEDILRAQRLMYKTSVLMLLLFGLCKLCLCL